MLHQIHEHNKRLLKKANKECSDFPMVAVVEPDTLPPMLPEVHHHNIWQKVELLQWLDRIWEDPAIQVCHLPVSNSYWWKFTIFDRILFHTWRTTSWLICSDKNTMAMSWISYQKTTAMYRLLRTWYTDTRSFVSTIQHTICAGPKTPSIPEFLDMGTSWFSFQRMKRRMRNHICTGMHASLGFTMQMSIILAMSPNQLSPNIWNFSSSDGFGVTSLLSLVGNSSTCWDLALFQEMTRQLNQVSAWLVSHCLWLDWTQWRLAAVLR